MGFLDTLFGRTTLPKPQEDHVFAITTAYIELQAAAGCEPANRAGIVFRNLPPGRFQQLVSDVRQLLSLEGQDTGMQVEEHKDELGFDWLVLSGAPIPDLTTALHAVAQSLMEDGLGELLLAAAFRFDQQGRPVYWIYSYKDGTFYPFVPSGDHQRENAEELRLAAIAKPELPVEPRLEKWFALYGLPV